MFDVGWSEMAVIAVVALVVIGPKDLPLALRTVGQYIRKARRLASDFQSSIDEMGREIELEEMKKKVNDAVMANTPAAMIEKTIDPQGELSQTADAVAGAADAVKKAVDVAPPEDAAPTAPMPIPTPAVDAAAAPSAAKND